MLVTNFLLSVDGRGSANNLALLSDRLEPVQFPQRKARFGGQVQRSSAGADSPLSSGSTLWKRHFDAVLRGRTKTAFVRVPRPLVPSTFASCTTFDRHARERPGQTVVRFESGRALDVRRAACRRPAYRSRVSEFPRAKARTVIVCLTNGPGGLTVIFSRSGTSVPSTCPSTRRAALPGQAPRSLWRPELTGATCRRRRFG